MRSRRNLPVYLCYVGICLLTLGVIVKGIGKIPWQSHPTVVATFRSADGLLADNDVYMNGVKVGSIDSVAPVGGQAVVTMHLADQHALPLYGDALAQVRKKNLLGETYVELDRGDPATGQLAADGSGARTIPVGHTITPVDIDQVLAILDPTTRDRVKMLINGAGTALNGNGANLNDEAGSTRQLATELNGPADLLSARRQQLTDIVVELQRVYDVLARQRDQIREELTTWSDVMGQLADQDTAVAGTLQQADGLLSNLDTVLTGEVPALQSALGQLPATLTSLRSFTGQAIATFNTVIPVRGAVHNIFPNLETTFAGSDANVADPLSPDGHAHFWSVYLASCPNGCSAQSEASTGPAAPNAQWAAVMGAGS